MLLGMMSLVVTGAWAADPDLVNDYTLVKSITWGDGTAIEGSGACAYTAYDTGNKKQQALTILTAPEAAAGWIAMQAWANADGSGKGWWNRQDKGLYCVNAGRSAAIFGDDLTTGWLVVFECNQNAANVMTLTNGNGDPDGTFTYVASGDSKSYYCTITAAENAYVGFCGNKNAGFISKISVYKPNNAVVLTTYTVNYVDMDGNTLKDPVTYDAVGGATITLSDADKANITIGEDTYVYDSDDTEGKTVAEDGSSVITVKFHKAQNFSYTVNEMCAGTAARVTESFSYETAKVTVPYRKYNAVDGQLYTKGATNKEYNYSFNLTQDNQVEDIDYAAVSDVDNVVFLTEGEDVEGLTPCNSPNTAIRSSNSASAYATADTKLATLAAGKYKIHAIIYDASKTPSSDWTFRAGAVEVAKFHCTTVNIQEFDSDEFAIGKETDIIMLKAGSNNMGLDMIYIVKTGDVTAEEAAELNAAADLAEAKLKLQECIEAVSAYGFPDLDAAITTAQAALEAEDATVESIEAAHATFEATVKAYLKKVLEQAIPLIESLKVEDLAELIAAAKGAVAKEDATLEELASALFPLINNAKPYIVHALEEIIEFAKTFDNTALEALKEELAATQAAIESGSFLELKAAIDALTEKALPYMKEDLAKLISYFEVMDNKTILDDLAALKTAMDANDLIAIVAAASKAKDDMVDVMPSFLEEVGGIIQAGKAEGKDVSALEAAYAAVATAVISYQIEGGSIITIGEAIYNLVKALEAYEKANNPADDGYIVNAAFNPEADPIGWTAVLSESFKDIGMYQIGGTAKIRNEFTAPTADESHLATEFAAGFEARWASSFSSYTQTTAEVPAGSYSLVYDVENVNASTTSANYENRFTVTVGETVYTDESTEWMKGGSAWTTHAIMFTLAENSPITISLGYGTGANNLPLQQTPALYVSHLQLVSVPAIEVALKELQDAINAAQAQADTYAIGDGLFQYAASEIEPLTQAIAAAQAAYDAKESEDAVKDAVVALNAFLSTFAPAISAPDADKAYTFQLRLDVETPLYMSLAESGISIQEEATPVKFIEAENAGQFYLANETSTFFVGLAGTNAWTMSTAEDKKVAWSFTALADGAYRINNLVTAGRFVGTNAADKEAGKPCYADKLPTNGNIDWIIAEYSGVTDCIKSLNADDVANGIYTLSGQKVLKAQKGLYIINGKKVMVK